MIAEDWGWYVPVKNEEFGSPSVADIRMAMTTSF